MEVPFRMVGFAFALLVLSGCAESGSSGSCEQVTQGNSRVVIENQLRTGVEAFFPDLAFAALMRPGKCEIFGMPAGSREVELTQCTFIADNDCSNFGQTVFIDLPLGQGEEMRIDVTPSMF